MLARALQSALPTSEESSHLFDFCDDNKKRAVPLLHEEAGAALIFPLPNSRQHLVYNTLLMACQIY